MEKSVVDQSCLSTTIVKLRLLIQHTIITELCFHRLPALLLLLLDNWRGLRSVGHRIGGRGVPVVAFPEQRPEEVERRTSCVGFVGRGRGPVGARWRQFDVVAGSAAKRREPQAVGDRRQSDRRDGRRR